MNRAEFLLHECTQSLLGSLVPLLTEPDRGLDFRLAPSSLGDSYLGMSHALGAYSWPARSSLRLRTPDPQVTIQLRRHSNFVENAAALLLLQDRLRSSFDNVETDDALAGWVAAVMEWGGVYMGANVQWLEREVLEGTLRKSILKAVSILRANDEAALMVDPPIRSNAALTKIYSLLLPNFVIYDSRVAGALAWLVLRWSQQADMEIPDHLRFGCMRSRGDPLKVTRKPDSSLFSYLAYGDNGQRKHAVWNLRANWLIEAWLREAAGQIGTALDTEIQWNPRKVEAALFMVGNDLSAAT